MSIATNYSDRNISKSKIKFCYMMQEVFPCISATVSLHHLFVNVLHLLMSKIVFYSCTGDSVITFRHSSNSDKSSVKTEIEIPPRKSSLNE
jgi:hypothetical protein